MHRRALRRRVCRELFLVSHAAPHERTTPAARTVVRATAGHSLEEIADEGPDCALRPRQPARLSISARRGGAFLALQCRCARSRGRPRALSCASCGPEHCTDWNPSATRCGGLKSRFGSSCSGCTRARRRGVRAPVGVGHERRRALAQRADLRLHAARRARFGASRTAARRPRVAVAWLHELRTGPGRERRRPSGPARRAISPQDCRRHRSVLALHHRATAYGALRGPDTPQAMQLALDLVRARPAPRRIASASSCGAAGATSSSRPAR